MIDDTTGLMHLEVTVRDSLKSFWYLWEKLAISSRKKKSGWKLMRQALAPGKMKKKKVQERKGISY